MSKIPVSSIIADFQMMYQQHWAYGTEVKRGQVDCSGAFVWSYKQHGHSIYHGSNRMARVEVEEMIPIGKAVIVPGMAAFKAKAPGLLNGYALPDSYKKGGANYNGDLNDYYHVGLVGSDTSQVLNAQSAATGFVSSDISKGGWSHVSYLKQVDYGINVPVGSTGGTTDSSKQPSHTDGTVTRKAVTYAETGGTVNMRVSSSTSAKLVERVPVGETVTAYDDLSGEWSKATWGRYTGYMMTKFLLPYGEDGKAPDIPDTDASGGVADYGTATICAENGLPVKLRRTASTKLPYIEKLPVGTVVTVRGHDSGGWTPVTWNGYEGYVMTEFLVPDEVHG